MPQTEQVTTTSSSLLAESSQHDTGLASSLPRARVPDKQSYQLSMAPPAHMQSQGETIPTKSSPEVPSRNCLITTGEFNTFAVGVMETTSAPCTDVRTGSTQSVSINNSLKSTDLTDARRRDPRLRQRRSERCAIKEAKIISLTASIHEDENQDEDENAEIVEGWEIAILAKADEGMNREDEMDVDGVSDADDEVSMGEEVATDEGSSHTIVTSPTDEAATSAENYQETTEQQELAGPGRFYGQRATRSSTIEHSAHSADIETNQSELKSMITILTLIAEALTKEGKLSAVNGDQIRNLLRIVAHHPNEFPARYERLLLEERSTTEKYKQLAGKAMSIQFTDTGGPPIPNLDHIHIPWGHAMDNIRQAIGLEDQVPDHLPDRADAGYLTQALEYIASGRLKDDELEGHLQKLAKDGVLASLYSIQALMSALLIRWLFQAPEPMLSGQYTDMLMSHYKDTRNFRKSDARANMTSSRD